jgi:hypothetical protein
LRGFQLVAIETQNATPSPEQGAKMRKLANEAWSKSLPPARWAATAICCGEFN